MGGEAAACCCGSVSIDKLNSTVGTPPSAKPLPPGEQRHGQKRDYKHRRCKRQAMGTNGESYTARHKRYEGGTTTPNAAPFGRGKCDHRKNQKQHGRKYEAHRRELICLEAGTRLRRHKPQGDKCS